jgi:hypothetical protein
MPLEWRKGAHPEVIATELEQTKIVAADGTTSFAGGLGIRDLHALLRTMLKWPQEPVEADQKRIVSAAVWEAARKGVITKDSLLHAIAAQEKKYRAKTRERFVLVSSLSLRPHKKIRTRNLLGVRFQFSPSLPKRFAKPHVQFVEETTKRWGVKPPGNYLFCRAYIYARSAEEAGNVGQDVLNCLRGLWNWAVLPQFKITSGTKAPVNIVGVGPIHTLHKPTGELAASVFWYEPSYVSPHDLAPPTTYDKMVRFEEQGRRKLARCRYRKVLAKALSLYATAFGRARRSRGVLEAVGSR